MAHILRILYLERSRFSKLSLLLLTHWAYLPACSCLLWILSSLAFTKCKMCTLAFKLCPALRICQHSDLTFFGTTRQLIAVSKKLPGWHFVLLSPAGCEAWLSWTVWIPAKVAELIRSLGHFSINQLVTPKYPRCRWAHFIHPHHVAYHSYFKSHLLSRRGWLNMWVPVIYLSRSAKAGSQSGAKNATLWVKWWRNHCFADFCLLLKTIDNWIIVSLPLRGLYYRLTCKC